MNGIKNEELLMRAEVALEDLKSRRSMEAIQAQAIESIAASLLVIARNSMPIKVEQKVETPDLAMRQDRINNEVGRRIEEDYRKFWNSDTARFEIDKGTENEWIATEDELYDDVRRSVEDELTEEVA
jgi:hypothetical protein